LAVVPTEIPGHGAFAIYVPGGWIMGCGSSRSGSLRLFAVVPQGLGSGARHGIKIEPSANNNADFVR